MTLAELVTDPDRFFERRSEDPSMTKPLLVVVLVGLLGIVSSYPILRATMSAMPEEASGFSSIVLAVGVLGAVVGPLILWVLLTALFHGLSAIAFGGEGSFKTNLALVGWGMAPAILSNLFSGVVGWLFLRTIEFPNDPQQIQTFLRSQPAFVALTVVGIAFTLWQGLLWVFAEKHARRLTLRQAAITVGVPVALYVLYQVSNLV